LHGALLLVKVGATIVVELVVDALGAAREADDGLAGDEVGLGDLFLNVQSFVLGDCDSITTRISARQWDAPRSKYFSSLAASLAASERRSLMRGSKRAGISWAAALRMELRRSMRRTRSVLARFSISAS
jgi:hypothetical protein